MDADAGTGIEAPGDALRCRAVSVDYGSVPALTNVDLSVARGEVVALLGASGSGKSTLLHAIAGLVPISRGEIRVADRVMSTPRRTTPPELREVGMVFQDHALWPHLSVLDTVAYPLRRAGHSRDEAAGTASDLLSQLDIEHLAARRPAELSGTDRQRVGLARALAREAQLYLLDEPTGDMLAPTRQRDNGAATVYATDDAAEALALADRVALLVDGRVIQVASPEKAYAEPVNIDAAELTGPCSVLDAVVAVVGPISDGVLSVDFGAGPVAVLGGGTGAGQARPRQLLVRPDWVREGGPLLAKTTAVEFRGPHTDYHVTTPGGPLLLRLPGPPHHAVGESMSWTLERAWVISGPDAEPIDLIQPRAMIGPQ